MRRPRLLFFIPTLAVGGAEIQTLRLAQRLQAAAFPVDILVHGEDPSEPLARWPIARDAHRLGLRGLSDPGGWLKVWRLLRRLDPDIVVCVNQTPYLVAEFARQARATRARLVCILHTTVMQAFEAHLERPFRLLARNRLDLLVFVGEGQRRVWRERGARARRECVIHNGVDLDKFAFDDAARRSTRARLGIAADAFVLGMVATFRAEKRHDDVIRALALARARGSAAILIAVGGGPCHAATREAARALGVEGAVRFVGEQDNVTPYLAAADIGVIASSIETFPLTALEFLAAGRPMLTSAVVGALEIVPPQNRLTHAVGDVEQLARNILSAQNGQTYRDLATRARDAVARFDEPQMAAAYQTALQELFEDAP